MRKTNFTRMLLIIALVMIGTASRGAMLKSTNDSTVVNFNYSSQNGTVHFTDTTMSTVAIASRTWQFGDSTTSTLKNPTHTYAANIYKANVCLTVKTINGTSFTRCKIITVRTIDTCAANYAYVRIDSSGASPIYRFTDTSFGTSKIVSRKWVFADSTTKTDSVLTHQFASSLINITVCLTIKTSSGCQSSICKTIILKDTIPTCKASFVARYQPDTSATGGARYLFTNTSSSNATSFLWMFGDGTSSTIKSPIHTYYLAPGSKVYVRLQIKTNVNCTDTFAQIITIPKLTNDSCVANFTYVRTDNSGVYPTVRFTDTSFGSSKVTWRQWSLSDSTRFTDSTFVHQFASNLSQVTVNLTIGTASGCQASVYKTITLKDTIPVTCKAGFVATYLPDSSATRGARYLFTNTSSSNATSFAWMFGDGASSTVKSPIHTYYLTPGSKVYVRLQIKTNVNCTDTFVQIITIPKLTNDSCTANFTYVRTDNSGVYPIIRFTDTSFGSSKVAWRQWSLSDSTHSTDSTFIHKFASNLLKATVYLTIGTTSGCQASVYKTITLKDSSIVNCKASFVASYQPDSSGVAGSRYVFTNTSSSNAISFVWSFGDGTSSTLKNPVHIYNFGKDTIVPVGLFIRSAIGCTDSTSQQLTIHGNSTSYTIAGTVAGKDELLPQGIIALYKKATNGFYTIVDVKIISNGSFSFEKQSKGKYIIYAMPGIYYTNKYLPTYYVNKLHWADAQIIDLKSNAYGLTLQLVSVKSITPGPCKTSGKVVFSGAVEQKSLASDLAVSYQVNLYTESGAVLTSVTPDESGNFTFDNLPYGKYSIKVEYPNLTSDNLVVNLSPEVPEAANLSFLINTNTVSVSSLTKESKVTVYNVSETQIAVRLNTGGKYKVSLLNISGQVLMDEQIEFEMNSDKIITIGSVPKGIYMIKLQNNGSTIIEKLLK